MTLELDDLRRILAAMNDAPNASLVLTAWEAAGLDGNKYVWWATATVKRPDGKEATIYVRAARRTDYSEPPSISDAIVPLYEEARKAARRMAERIAQAAGRVMP